MTVVLEKLEVYQLSETLADLIWDICVTWDWFSKETIGKQLVKAVDSVGANIAEGYGRYAFRENIQFCYYARGSFEETRNWLRRANKRKLLMSDDMIEIGNIMDKLGLKLNGYINSIKRYLKTS